MIVKSFMDNCREYKNFQIWDIASMDDFMLDNPVLNEIFQNDYKMTYAESRKNRHKIEDTDLQIMHKLLEQIGDKHFFIFTWHDDNHSELVQMQNLKIMNWGIDINEIDKTHVYIVMMDEINPGNLYSKN